MDSGDRQAIIAAVEQDLKISLAGPAVDAVRRRSSLRPRGVGYSSDYKVALDMAAKIVCVDQWIANKGAAMAVTVEREEVDKIIAAQWRETLDLVALHWGAIKRTAAVLTVKDISISDELAIAFAGP